MISHIPKEKRRKLDSKGKRGYFVGHGDVTKGFRIHFEEEDTVEIKRDVVFIKVTNNEHLISNEKNTETEVIMEENSCNIENSMEDEINDDDVTKDKNDMESEIPREVQITDEASIKNKNTRAEYRNEELSTKGSEEEELVVTNSVETQEQTIRLRPRNLIRGPQWQKDYITDYTCLLSFIEDDPKTYEDAMESTEKLNWKRAMEEEIDSLNKNNTWDIVPKPENC